MAPSSAFFSVLGRLPNQLESDQSELFGRTAQRQFWRENGPNTVQNGRKAVFRVWEILKYKRKVGQKGPK